jgi:hypothetical protein
MILPGKNLVGQAPGLDFNLANFFENITGIHYAGVISGEKPFLEGGGFMELQQY